MAEVLGIGASLIAIIQITDRIVGLCKHYITTVKDAPSDLRFILLETSALKNIFENLDFLTGCDCGVSNIVSGLAGVDGPIEGCLKSVTQLEKLFPSDWMQDARKNRSKKQKVKATLAALAWPLKETKARKLLDEISRYKTTITLAITTESIQDIKEIKAKAVEVHSLLTESQRQEVYRWLQHTDPSSIHFRAQKDYEPGTGSWMLRAPEWSSWLDASKRCLWIHGIPGAGKTVLMSYLIEQIKQHCSSSQTGKCASVYYYCYFGRNQNETVPFLRWLINQLCRRADSVPRSVYELYKHGVEPSFEELLAAVEAILENFNCTYLAIDALDESIPRDDLLQILKTLATDSRFKKLQILVSSREYIDIEKVIEKFSVSVSMANPYVEEDIRLHVRSTLQANSKFKRWPQNLLDEVEDTLSKGARGMFRWAVCQIDVLRRLKCERDNVKKALKSLPKTLDETYEMILLAIPHEDLVVVSHILQWISYHNELYHGQGIPCEVLIQAVGKSTAELTTDGLERFYDNDVLRELCGCLIKILPEDRSADPKSCKRTVHAVSFAHYTVREYFDSRCSTNTVISSTVGQEDLRQRILEVVLSEAHHIDLNQQRKVRNGYVDPSDIFEAIDGNLNDYCIASAILSLYERPTEMSQQERLCSMSIDLLNPSGPHYETLKCVVAMIDASTPLFSNRASSHYGLSIVRKFWHQHWHTETSMDAVHLFNLLHLGRVTDKCLPLAEKFLQVKDTRDFLQARMKIEMDVPYLLVREDGKSHLFDGSIIEIFAQLAISSAIPLMLLLDYGAGLFDCSKVLLLYIGSHLQGFEGTGYCPLRKLLELGADPNSRGSRITPLQIAVGSWDLDGVRTLLNAGADPNGIGSSGGIAWEDGTFMSRFNHLEGASALHICRNYEYTGLYLENAYREKDLEMIEATLLQYGAKDFLKS